MPRLQALIVGPPGRTQDFHGHRVTDTPLCQRSLCVCEPPPASHRWPAKHDVHSHFLLPTEYQLHAAAAYRYNMAVIMWPSEGQS